MHPNMCIFTDHMYLVMHSNMHGHNAAVDCFLSSSHPLPILSFGGVECMERAKQEAERLRWVGSYVLGTLVS